MAGRALGAVLLTTVALHAAATTTLERIKATAVMTVCADPDNLPLSDSRLDPPGYDIEIAAAIAESLGAKLQYNWFVTERMGKFFRELYDGNCDFIVGVPIDRRLDGAGPRLALSRPYLVSGFALLIDKESRASRIEDLKGQRIGVGLHTVSDFALFDLGFERALYAKQADVFEALAKGEIAAGMVWAPVAGWLAKQRPTAQVRILSETRPELTFSLAVAVRKEDSTLLDAINAAIGDVIQSGRRDKILAKYGVPQLRSSTGSSDEKIFRMGRRFASLSMPESRSPLRRAVWYGPKSDRPHDRVSQSPFIRTVGGNRRASDWSAASEQEAQESQGANEPAKVRESAESHGGGNESGYSLYHRACGKCHGRNVISGGIFPDLRRFEGTDQEFLDTVKNGRPGTVMPAWEKVLKTDEIERIREYVKSVAAD